MQHALDGSEITAPPLREEVDYGFIKEHVGFQVLLTGRALRGNLRKPGDSKPSGWFSALALIGLNPGISQKQLAEALFLDPSIIVGIIDDLEKSKLATRTRSPADRRRLELNLTRSGEDKMAQVRTISQSNEAILGQALDADERELLAKLLAKVRATLPGPRSKG